MPRTGAPLGSISILMVEDCPEDAELLVEQLLDAGLEADFVRVDNAGDMRAELARRNFDIVLSDLAMPGFSGHEALRILREHDPGVPFIFVSGTMGEETAVQALQEGAHDYVLKHNPVRLPSAVARAIREARGERERERAEKELMRAQRLDSLAMLAAGLSHDLRNILQPLLIVPDLLASYSDDPKIRRLGNVIAESGRRGHEMAESMLSFVRGSRVKRESVSIAALFHAVQLLLQGSLPRHVTLVVEPPAEDLAVQANYTEFQQCLINLCLNGIQAMPRPGTLSLSAQRLREGGEDWVAVLVSDQGIGMDEQTLAQLFTPFFTTKQQGSGLGLLSCKRILEANGGRISVHSLPGDGSTFELRLPAQRVADEAGAADENFAEGQGQRILVVDGDSTRLSLVANALASQGYDPMVASDGAAALRIVASDGLPRIAIVDSDILLLSAVSLMLALRERGFDGPVLILKDPAQPPVRFQDLPPGIEPRLLGKPVQMSQLFRAVEEALASC
ncbi:response regulator [Pseudoxanthomonas mexicana]|uniref:hybrid sensor histidine kinase/response regulator n=1 Tax=Pseudoxanthomonas mexicana TaxID=128785 RepID=UPI00398B56FC